LFAAVSGNQDAMALSCLVENRKAQLRVAAGLRGKDTIETEAILIERHKPPQVRK
jgi:aldehyde:ferredoxin oxidoreductase